MCTFSSFQQRQQSQQVSAACRDKGQRVTHPGRSLNSPTFADATASFFLLYFRAVEQQKPCFTVTETHQTSLVFELDAAAARV